MIQIQLRSIRQSKFEKKESTENFFQTRCSEDEEIAEMIRHRSKTYDACENVDWENVKNRR